MIRIPIAFHKNLLRGEIPIAYVMIITHLANRIYSDRELKGIFAAAGCLADGTYLADGSILAGAQSTGGVEKSARVLDFGKFERSIVPQTSDLLLAYTGKQIQNNRVVLDNTDNYFTRMIAQEPFLTRELRILIGFEDQPQDDHFPLFAGIITDIEVDENSMTIEAGEM